MNGADLQAFIENMPVAAAMFDCDMKYVAMSPRWRVDYERAGDPRENRHCEILPEIPQRWREARSRVLGGETVISPADRFERADGSIQWVRWEFMPWRAASGEICGVVILAEDVTGRELADAALRDEAVEMDRQRDQIEWLYENAPIGLCHLDRDLRYLCVNRWLAEINGLPIEAHIGRRVREVAPALAPGIEESARKILSTGEALRDIEFRGRAPRPPGVARYFSLSLHPAFDSEGQIIGFNVVVHEVTEKKRIHALCETDRRKDEFLATLAHELRNPLAPIKNAVHVLRLLEDDDSATKEKRRAALERAGRQVDHMARLVDDLLEITRISHGKVELRKARTDLAAILTQAIDLSQPQIQAGSHRLAVDLSAEPLQIDGDPVRLAQVFTNLINNAARYTDAGGRIEIAAAREGEEAVVTVRDNGIGIPRQQLSSIFEMFAQVEPTCRRAPGGIGVGLALARSVVQLHGGRIEARSEGLGRGSEFIVRLPLAAHVETPAMAS
ncbi:PAS domain-containing sensor histidine kinase [Methylocystis sp. WRRC1]|uniref:sensor histidine kinase n=1 Tax=Methylocystis sp. WRRC1 TaxID=1732014 RepID=UPI001D147E7A|nr:PAS domain-containing sensor histidine kinase [Methylocystis sp. WRRC1]MCC3246632.1 PAS domain-containing sensor histidine kinase [Methylocystis sp. WRRC1]